MLNPKLEEAIEIGGAVLLGGTPTTGQCVTAVAFHLGKSPATIYNWRSAGGVDGLLDAIGLARLAGRGGWRGTLENLARDEGVDDGDGERVARPTSTRAASEGGGTMRNDVRGATALLRKRKVRAKRHEADDRPMLGCHIGPLVPTPDDLLADAA